MAPSDVALVEGQGGKRGRMVHCLPVEAAAAASAVADADATAIFD